MNPNYVYRSDQPLTASNLCRSMTSYYSQMSSCCHWPIYDDSWASFGCSHSASINHPILSNNKIHYNIRKTQEWTSKIIYRACLPYKCIFLLTNLILRTLLILVGYIYVLYFLKNNNITDNFVVPVPCSTQSSFLSFWNPEL